MQECCSHERDNGSGSDADEQPTVERDFDIKSRMFLAKFVSVCIMTYGGRQATTWGMPAVLVARKRKV